MLADHDGVEPGILCDDGHLDERAQIARRRQRPVLGEDEDELRGVIAARRPRARGGVDRGLLVWLDLLAGHT